ncbi:hypothetical protein [Streptomyces sp. NPDC049879]|uniref:hypothetical protein n=1 Tax=Streptomyces sp. NPDC049879 TaxID=3365598 RepID=UPI00379E9123
MKPEMHRSASVKLGEAEPVTLDEATTRNLHAHLARVVNGWDTVDAVFKLRRLADREENKEQAAALRVAADVLLTASTDEIRV